MGRIGQKQVALGPTLPSFPGGWVMAVLDAALNEALIHRSASRLRSGKSVEAATYQEWETKLVDAVKRSFPRVSAINGFAAKYVNEYFRLWRISAEAAPLWESHFDPTPSSIAVLGRAALRDLLLRVCYLESCERHLAGLTNTVLIQSQSIHDFYAHLLEQSQRCNNVTQEKLAAKLGIDPVIVRRWKSGKAVPTLSQLQLLTPAGDERVFRGVRFLDLLLRQLGYRWTLMADECTNLAAIFLREHPAALANFRKNGSETEPDFRDWAMADENLLLHAGFFELRAAMPDALWRAHLYALQFARPFDLARAYLRFSTVRDDFRLENFLLTAEGPGRDPSGWLYSLDEADW